MLNAALQRAGPPPWASLAGLALIASVMVAPLIIQGTVSPCGALARRLMSAEVSHVTDPVALRLAGEWARTEGPGHYAELVSRDTWVPAPITCTAHYWLSVFNPPSP